MRKTTALIAALALLASLTACASGPGSNGCDPLVSSGNASSAVTATGKFGTAPKVKFPTPLYTKSNEKTQVIAGKGAPIQDGQPVALDVTILNGTNGKVLQSSSYAADGFSLVTVGKSSIPSVTEALRCATVGSRVVIVGSPKDSHSGQADDANGIGKNDSFVYVVDVRNSFLAKADGANQIPQNDMPLVVTTADGTPGISIPSSTAPKSLKIDVLKQGSGTKVKTGNYLIVQYTGVPWSLTDKKPFDSTWSEHQASVIQVGAASVSTGLSKALVGQRVGSQVLVVAPPKDAAVADGSGKAPTDNTSVYVVDILGIAQ
ncbi:FKBP-type peptidyl-prolyl cis-trans isomerase [Glaciihabitans sp. UYNi722]|uniref:FKBP-type peptidyl-prolyl cis-trans isomerase n=1 Tax=Glaciihabitans sp. UYNi722 TaxID=3156344 RepID=UPI003391AA21